VIQDNGGEKSAGRAVKREEKGGDKQEKKTGRKQLLLTG